MRPPALHVATEADAPSRDTHFVPQPAARHAMTALEGSFNALRRAMCGPSTPEALRAEIQRLARQVATEAANVGRFTR